MRRPKNRSNKRDTRHWIIACIAFWILSPLLSNGQKVISITVNDGINPSTAEYIEQGIETAQKEQAQCLIINLNTPGGLLTSTRNIVSGIMQSQVPVVVYVSPTGAHAGSAGTFITLAANIAAMAPGTNIGAAHPVDMQGKSDAVMNEKVINDASAFIRTIAEKRGRNVKWADDAVRTSVSLTEAEALEKNVIDIVADNENDLLTKLDGKEVQVNGVPKILQTKNATVEPLEMGFFQKVLSRLSDPNISYIIMMLGFYGLIFELFSPGAIFPGIIGVICLILAFYSMSSMPVNYAGLGLIIFGIILYLLEIKIVSHGLLAIGGTVSVLLGSMILFRTSPVENYVSLSWSVIISVTAFSTLFFLFLVTMGLRAQRSKPASGVSTMIGQTALTLGDLNPAGQVSVLGEIWKAVSLSGKIPENEKVTVKEIKELTLYVEPENKQV
ncbi:nodulation protein NfeD [Hanamia caeni]|uniref:Nodulation protein NfeD n=1 Tax=Hanamia caeni TaxID=2294116 RepID=A0A3M9NEJ5_9BACT|nr:nodulation protein NfeD [Hanamia caeni]RNI36151.1 nodulation protein NfeD [Hanamia caeni]